MIEFNARKNLLFVLLSLLSQFVTASSLNIADQIQQTFETNLYKLKPRFQSHFAVRMYRISGKKSYLYPIISYQFIESKQLSELIDSIKSSPEEVSRPNAIVLPENHANLNKVEIRKYLLSQAPSMSRMLNMLLILDHAQQLNLLNSSLYPKTKIALSYLKKNSKLIKEFCLNPTVIKNSSAQLANYVFLLHRLQLIDFRKDYIRQFRIVFSDGNDQQLNDKQFEEKIYGLTHIIIAASNYYQKQLSPTEYNWIYRYFNRNIQRILERTKPDVIAEVGLCFRLLNVNNPLVLKQIKAYLRKEFRSEQQIIPNKTHFDLNVDEHRNILTIMLFNWPLSLHPGPNLKNEAFLLTV